MKKSSGRPSRTFPRSARQEVRTDRPRETPVRSAVTIRRRGGGKSGKLTLLLWACTALAIVLILLLIRPCREGKRVRLGPAARDGIRAAADDLSGEGKERGRKNVNRAGETGADLHPPDESAEATASEKRTPNLGTEIEIVEPK